MSSLPSQSAVESTFSWNMSFSDAELASNADSSSFSDLSGSMLDFFLHQQRQEQEWTSKQDYLYQDIQLRLNDPALKQTAQVRAEHLHQSLLQNTKWLQSWQNARVQNKK